MHFPKTAALAAALVLTALPSVSPGAPSQPAPGLAPGLPKSAASNTGCAAVPVEVFLPLAALSLAEFLRHQKR